MTNSYPAKRLQVDYRVRMDVVVPGESADGAPKSLRKAIYDTQSEALLKNVVQEIDRAVAGGASQVIFFAQDKAFLRDIERALTVEDGRGAAQALDPEQVAILDASVLSARKKELVQEPRRDRVKVFLMTSSAARGVSFPKTDWIIALVPRFEVEAALMELAQLIYRGRGGRYTADDETNAGDGDWKDRRLVMMLQDFLPAQDEPEPRQWLRQVSDLLTFVVMLRAAIHTRILGDAGLERNRLAVVPVGRIGTDETLSLMSTHVAEFLRESEVFLHDSRSPRELRGLVTNAQRNVRELFSKFSLDGRSGTLGARSVVRIEDVAAFQVPASSDGAPLLPEPHSDPAVLLPPNLYCVGPYWLESWAEMETAERNNFEGWLSAIDTAAEDLFGELKAMHQEPRLPFKLKNAAEELYRILSREKEEATREFSTVKDIESPNIWVSVPVDYPRFWKPREDGRMPTLGGEDEAWRDCLGRCLGAHRDALPVIPRYEDYPYAACVGNPDPARLAMVFDDRYFMASNELNLLNTLLLG
jgi:hypothetical protein